MRPRKRAAPKPKEKKVGDKAPGRKPTYTTSSGEKVSKINLTPTTKSLSCMIGRVLLVIRQQWSLANIALCILLNF
jgi:hypothetical protein